MDIAARQATPMPYDREIQWLQSVERTSQYFDAGYMLKAGDIVEIEAQLISPDSYWGNAYFFGSTTNGGGSWLAQFFIHMGWNGKENRFEIVVRRQNFQVPDTAKYLMQHVIIKTDGNMFKLYDADRNLIVDVQSGVAPVNTESNCFILKCSEIVADNIVKPCKDSPAIRLFAFKIFSGNKAVVDMIPVIDKNGIGCLYDKAKDTLSYNLGSGSLVIGPDKRKFEL